MDFAGLNTAAQDFLLGLGENDTDGVGGSTREIRARNDQQQACKQIDFLFLWV